MTTPLWCLIVVLVLPYLWAGVGGYYIHTRHGGLDNKYHRLQQAKLEGPAARAYGAHYNANEAIAPFTAAVLTAHILHADPTTSANLSLGFVACRFLHGVFYVADRDVLRSLIFFGALACMGGLFHAAYVAGGS